MHSLVLLLLLAKLGLVLGLAMISFLLLRSAIHSGRQSPVYAFRARAGTLAAFWAAEILMLTVRSGAPDTLLPAVRAQWQDWPLIELLVVAGLVGYTISVVRLLVGQHQVIDQALGELGRLRSEAARDCLTGLDNRKVLDEQLSRLVDGGEPFGIVFIDVDEFKPYNDTYGHLAGDEVLITLARVMRAQVRKSDLVVRYGGEEFVVVLPGANLTVSLRSAEHICAAVSAASFPHRRVTVACGAAAFPASGATFEEVIHQADAAMYRAKSGGGNRAGAGADVPLGVIEEEPIN